MRGMYRKLETSVVIPCYNEEKMITQTIKKLPKYIDHVIAVNDASTDDTIGVLNKLKNQFTSYSSRQQDKSRGWRSSNIRLRLRHEKH